MTEKHSNLFCIAIHDKDKQYHKIDSRQEKTKANFRLGRSYKQYTVVRSIKTGQLKVDGLGKKNILLSLCYLIF